MTASVSFPSATILGYPRVGPNRELKRAVESFWAGRSELPALEEVAVGLRSRNLEQLAKLGLAASDSAIPNSFSFYDQVLDAAVEFNAVPSRFQNLANEDGSYGLPAYFTIARGVDALPPLEMTKWFDTNYHYLVPEISESTDFKLVGSKFVTEFQEAAAAGFTTRPVIVGPVTFLALAKAAEDAAADFEPLSRLADLLPVYVELLKALKAAGASWVQLDEPALVTDNLRSTAAELADAAGVAYQALAAELSLAERPAILVTTPFGGLKESFPAAAALPVEALAIDLVKGEVPATGVAGLENKTLVAGVIDGHNIWAADLEAKLQILESLEFGGAAALAVGTSTSFITPSNSSILFLNLIY